MNTHQGIPPRWLGRHNNERGNYIMELALLLPVLLALTFAVMDFGWYVFTQNTLQHATREGMRLAMVGGTENGQDRTTSIINKIKEKASVAIDPNNPDFKISIFKVGDNYSDPEGWAEAQATAGNPADYMRVRVEWEHKWLTGQFLNLGGPSIHMEAEGTYRNEQFEQEV